MRRFEITENHRSVGLLLLRLGAAGFMLFGHGLPKLLDYGARFGKFPDPLGLGPVVSQTLATGAEFLGALLVVVGLVTRPAALAVAFTMLVAGLVQHAGDPFGRRELPLLFAVVFVSLALTGPGRFSLDAWIARRRGRMPERQHAPGVGDARGEHAGAAAR